MYTHDEHMSHTSDIVAHAREGGRAMASDTRGRKQNRQAKATTRKKDGTPDRSKAANGQALLIFRSSLDIVVVDPAAERSAITLAERCPDIRETLRIFVHRSALFQIAAPCIYHVR